MTEYLESFVNIAYDILSNWPPLNNSETSLEIIWRVATNDVLLQELSQRTNLTTDYINYTIVSVLDSADRIGQVYLALNSTDNQGTSFNTTPNASRCKSFIAPDEMILFSLIPAVIILFVLSMTTSRVWKTGCLGGRPGLVIPVNLLDSFENRYCYAVAFGATATRIIQVILKNDFGDIYGAENGDIINTYPGYVKALLKIMAAIILGVSYYPFFACLSTPKRLLGAIIGTLYSIIWLLSYILNLAKCGVKTTDNQTLVINILFAIPPVLCHTLLVICYLMILMRSFISKRRGMVVSKDEWKENYKYSYVKKLLKPFPKSEQIVIVNGFKRKIRTSLYKLEPGFKYSTRIICIYVTACISLYLVLVYFVGIGRLLFDLLKTVAEYVRDESMPKDRPAINRVIEAIEVTTICWMVACAAALIKDIVMIANMLSWYRGHVLRLQRGDRSFLPVDIEDKNSVDIMVASFKFAGYQVAYIVWGFVLTHLVIFLLTTGLALLVIWPWTFERFAETPAGTITIALWPTIFISLLTILFQSLLARFVFLRDFGKAGISINNRRLYHIFSYFFFFLNIFVGVFSCLMRIFYAMAFGLLFLPRLQKSALPRDWELLDPGYKTYVGYLCLEHSHTNPIMCTFSQLLLETMENRSSKTPLQRRKKQVKNRWLLLLTLVNNTELSSLRRQEMPKSVGLTIANMTSSILTVQETIEADQSTGITNSVL